MLAATSEDLQAAVRTRRFREDLYHRIAVVTLRLPPLRERGSDILLLARHYLRRACVDYVVQLKTLTADAESVLLAYPWPGNVCELANIMERVVLLSDDEQVTPAILGLPRESLVRGAPPFFVEEVVRSLRESGALERQGDSVGLARPKEALDVPDTVQDVIWRASSGSIRLRATCCMSHR